MPNRPVKMDELMPEIAVAQARLEDIRNALAHSILRHSGINYCFNPNHVDSDGQEDHDNEVACIYHYYFHAICHELINT